MWIVQKFRRFDSFAGQASGLNFKGEQKMYTIPGAIISIGLSIFLLNIAVRAIIDMVSFDEVTIQNFRVEQNEAAMAQKIIDLTENHFDMAIGFLPFEGKRVLLSSDPSLVKIEIIMRSD